MRFLLHGEILALLQACDRVYWDISIQMEKCEEVRDFSMVSEIKIVTGFGTLGAKRWGQGRHKVLAMHGWLDNAASFDHVAPLLQDTECVALDFLGHGLSDHLAKQTPYTLDVQIRAIEEVIEYLGWSQFSILGHSLGAIVGTCIAASHPKRVNSLVSLDALGPISTDLMESDHPVAETVDKIRSRSNAAPRIYESIEQMYQSRARANRVDAKVIQGLVERSAKAVEGGGFGVLTQHCLHRRN
ncbi:alpha/beta fold hydrolase [Piscirickettsia litoralis]|uniref:alpha/beta fold hydrolase n=1 Tax=Piscirickettsia litoralis TaxID=1891921 RepID=UPI000B0A244D|nr:alpha/beta fold hydrolase [Piscirickettsia litoralis]